MSTNFRNASNTMWRLVMECSTNRTALEKVLRHNLLTEVMVMKTRWSCDSSTVRNTQDAAGSGLKEYRESRDTPNFDVAGHRPSSHDKLADSPVSLLAISSVDHFVR